ncbi:MAG: adenylate/guanylate cyclase domain-containing protein [Chloroflexi bacterium]|nr:adenylate/guanylate cyclase domain-containing protein [Chloroflexota bacterium]
MEPRIQYAKTEDGVSIAYSTIGGGEGTPLVEMPLTPWSHIQMQSQLPAWLRYTDRLSEKRMLVRYDPRGSGLSDRHLPDYSLDSLVLDLEAIVAAVGLDRFALISLFFSGPLAITYAARHPEQLSHLLLWCTYASGREYADLPAVKAFQALRKQDWEIYTQTGAHAFLGWAAAEHARWYAEYMQKSTTQEAAAAFYEANEQFETTPLLAQLRTPTLVMHRRDFTFPGVDAARTLASRIPNAYLTILDGASAAPFLEDSESVVRAISEFVGEGEESATQPEPPEAGAFRTILFTDIEQSTALTQRLGDARARAVLRNHERITREALKEHGGSEVKTMGDGFMASFSSATKALECAIATQRAFAKHNESAEEPIQVRIGLNAGEPIAEEDDLFGTAVITAARIAAKAQGGEILTSDTVRQIVAGKDFLFSDRGAVELRGFEDPVRLYEVRWREET